MTLNRKQLIELERLRKALGIVYGIAEERFTLSKLMTFLYVATHEGDGPQAVAAAMGGALSTVSRQLLDLGPEDRDRDRDAGMGLINRRSSKAHLGRVEYILSPEGINLVLRILDAIHGRDIVTAKKGDKEP